MIGSLHAHAHLLAKDVRKYSYFGCNCFFPSTFSPTAADESGSVNQHPAVCTTTSLVNDSLCNRIETEVNRFDSIYTPRAFKRDNSKFFEDQCSAQVLCDISWLRIWLLDSHTTTFRRLFPTVSISEYHISWVIMKWPRPSRIKVDRVKYIDNAWVINISYPPRARTRAQASLIEYCTSGEANSAFGFFWELCQAPFSPCTLLSHCLQIPIPSLNILDLTLDLTAP